MRHILSISAINNDPSKKATPDESPKPSAITSTLSISPFPS